MNDSTWTPQPGDRVLVRNAGEYGHCFEDRAEVEFLGSPNPDGPPSLARGRLSQVYDAVNVGEFTVLRSDLSPVEPPGITFAASDPRDAPTADHMTALYDWHEEGRRLTKEDYDAIERARKEAIVSEWLTEQLERIDPKLAESYRKRKGDPDEAQ